MPYTMEDIPESPTPETAAFWQRRINSEKQIHRAVRVVIGITTVFVLVSLFLLALFLSSSRTIQDQDHAQIQQLEARVTCQDKAFNAILKDVRLAFKNDKNPSDYSKAVTKC